MNSQLILFILAATALIITPGQDTIYVITRGIAGGKIAGVISGLGVCSGIVIHTLLAALGLSLILQSSTLVFLAVKYAGAIYLINLGIRTIFSKQSSVTNLKVEPSNLKILFRQGFISNLLNPKVALFFLAFLPQFVPTSALNTSLEILRLGIIFTCLDLIWLTSLGYFAGQLGKKISNSTAVNNALRWVSSSILIGLGLKLALAENH